MHFRDHGGLGFSSKYHLKASFTIPSNVLAVLVRYKLIKPTSALSITLNASIRLFKFSTEHDNGFTFSLFCHLFLGIRVTKQLYSFVHFWL